MVSGPISTSTRSARAWGNDSAPGTWVARPRSRAPAAPTPPGGWPRTEARVHFGLGWNRLLCRDVRPPTRAGQQSYVDRAAVAAGTHGLLGGPRLARVNPVSVEGKDVPFGIGHMRHLEDVFRLTAAPSAGEPIPLDNPLREHAAPPLHR